MTIAIPKGSYLKEFWVTTQKDIAESDCTAGAGIDYVEGVKNLGISSLQTVMDKIFEYQCDYTDPLTNNIYSIYKLKADFSWKYDNTKYGVGIEVSKKDLSIITLKLDSDSVPTNFVISSECGEDSTVLRIPLYDLLPARLVALNTAKGLDNICDLPKDFMDKVLQIKLIELALCCNDYCKALFYWHKFFDSEDKVQYVKCGCHG